MNENQEEETGKLDKIKAKASEYTEIAGQYIEDNPKKASIFTAIAGFVGGILAGFGLSRLRKRK